jgi:hypothetical protein
VGVEELDDPRVGGQEVEVLDHPDPGHSEPTGDLGLGLDRRLAELRLAARFREGRDPGLVVPVRLKLTLGQGPATGEQGRALTPGEVEGMVGPMEEVGVPEVERP